MMCSVFECTMTAQKRERGNMRSLGKFLGTAIICALFLNSAMAEGLEYDRLIKKAQSFNYASSPLQSVGIKTLEDLDRILGTTGKGTPQYDQIQNAIVELRIKIIKCGQYRVNPPEDYAMGAADRVSGAARAFESFDYFNTPEGARALKASGMEDEYKELADRKHVILQGARDYLREAKETKTGWAQSAVAKIEQEQLKQTLKPQIAKIDIELRAVQKSEPYKRAMEIITEIKTKTKMYRSCHTDEASLASFIDDMKNPDRLDYLSSDMGKSIFANYDISADNEATKSMISAGERVLQLKKQKRVLLSPIVKLSEIREFLKDKSTITLDEMEFQLRDLEARRITAPRLEQTNIHEKISELKSIIAFFKKS